ncbi:MAG: SDR family NAD(P)-dependent oxidoreductase [Balneolaceae bacterium]|nr:SDR family NAD(P)-dependent oxidoreductase [Balneolaceae bacterium]
MDMKNKLCIVTGANSGIGKATAMELASRDAYVVMICRNEERGLNAKKEIIQKTGNTGVELLLADFSYQYEIREVAEQIINKFEQVDVLINNAGTIFHKREETLDGIEKTFAVNHLGPFLLTNLLLPHLKKAPEARVINVASEAHRVGVPVFDLGNLQLMEGFGGVKAYGLSKALQHHVYV